MNMLKNLQAKFDEQDIVREIGSHRFPGFYESIFSHSDEFIDFEAEDKDEILYKFDIIPEDDIEVVFEYEDFNEYKTDVCKAYIEGYIEKIHDVLPYEITDHPNFKLEIIDKDDIAIYSPKYYNYDTDHCYSPIITNKITLQLIKEYTLKLNGVQQYIIDHFTSCDGFISFISNSFQEWKDLDIKEYEERHLIALLDMLIALSEEHGHMEISYAIAEDITPICYAHPTIYYKNKEVTEDELEKIMFRKMNLVEKVAYRLRNKNKNKIIKIKEMNEMNMKKITKMYMNVQKALDEIGYDSDEYYELMTFIARMFEEYSEEYGITKYSDGGSPTEEVEYYIEELKEKYL